jgi:hypothetical protein
MGCYEYDNGFYGPKDWRNVGRPRSRWKDQDKPSAERRGPTDSQTDVDDNNDDDVFVVRNQLSDYKFVRKDTAPGTNLTSATKLDCIGQNLTLRAKNLFAGWVCRSRSGSGGSSPASQSGGPGWRPGQSMWTGVSPSSKDFPCQYYSTVVLHTYISERSTIGPLVAAV